MDLHDRLVRFIDRDPWEPYTGATVVTIHEDLEAMADYKATQQAWQQMKARRAERKRSLRFWLNWRQVTTTAVTSSGRGTLHPGGVSGVVGTQPQTGPPSVAASGLTSTAARRPRLPDNPHQSHPAGIRFM